MTGIGSTVRGRLALLVAALGLLFLSFLLVVDRLDSLKGSPWVEDPVRDYAAGIVWAVLLGLTLLWGERRERRILLVLWFSRVLITCLVMPFYEGHYEILDAYMYHGAAVSGGIPQEYADSFLGTALVFRICHAITWLTGSSFRALLVVYSYIGMLGVWLFSRAVRSLLPGASWAGSYGIALFPSVLFWSSIIGKDPLIFLAAGGAAWALARHLRHGGRGALLLYVGCGLAAGAVRPWWALILGAAPVLGAMSCAGLRWRFALGAAAALGSAGIWGVTEHMRLQDIESAFRLVEGYSRGVEGGGSSMDAPEIGSLGDLVLFMPKAVVTALFRPFPWEAHNTFALLVSLENGVLAMLLLPAIPALWRACRRHPFLAWSAACLVLWLLVYAGFVSQNLGATARYRSVALMFVLALAYFSRRVAREAAAPTPSDGSVRRGSPRWAPALRG